MPTDNSNPTEDPFYRTLAMALDPIHVGSGSQRLGRVDSPIVREAATNLPYIPGSSLSGVSRAALAMAEGSYPRCAGKSDENRGESRTHCGKRDCPVCVTFGFSTKAGSLHGMAQFYDSHLVFFPVASLIGPVWVTCQDALKRAIPDLPKQVAISDAKKAMACTKIRDRLPASAKSKHINLGWLLLEIESAALDRDILKKALANILCHSETGELKPALDYILDRFVVVDDSLFSRIVNTNLEVRTNVSIDPETGAAADTALFTYEALPRGSVTHITIGFNDPAHFKIDKQDIGFSKECIRGYAKKALKMLELFGVGGMNTRGMGRIQLLEVVHEP
jgi:CRISPR-associated protein Cmr4